MNVEPSIDMLRQAMVRSKRTDEPSAEEAHAWQMVLDEQDGRYWVDKEAANQLWAAHHKARGWK